MPNCKFCNEQNLEWFQDAQEKWRLGVKLDINNFRQHKCNTPQTQEKSNNKRNWITFTCQKCGCFTKQNVKLVKSKSLNLCMDCDS